VTYNFRAQSLERRDGVWHVSDGKQRTNTAACFDVWPIQQVAKMTNLEIPMEVQAAIDGLIVNPMFIVSLGIRGKDVDQYTAIYFPEPEFLVKPGKFPSDVFLQKMLPSITYSIQAEITCKGLRDVGPCPTRRFSNT